MQISTFKRHLAKIIFATSVTAAIPVIHSVASTSIETNGYPISGSASQMSDCLGIALTNAEMSTADITGVVIEEKDYNMFVTATALNIREWPNEDSEILDKLKWGEEITVTGHVLENDFVRITYDGKDAFVHSDYLDDEKPKKKVKKTSTTAQITTATSNWSGAKLTRSAGRINGPSGQETYYNLNMSGVVRIMRRMGINDAYWVRSDGVKMLGNYVMVAADLSIRPRGSLVQTSLGMGRVCDTGTFIYSNRTQLDIATAW